MLNHWISINYIEVLGAIAGIIYVFLEIRQHIWLWPVGILTSAVYVWIFFTGKLYADMSLQVYYLVISFLGWYWWLRGDGRGSESRKTDKVDGGKGFLPVTRLRLKTGIYLALIFVLLYACMWIILSYFTDSPVPGWDSFITSLSIVATWMLARKIYEHWYLWIIVNTVSAILFFSRGLYPTLVLYLIYGIMSFSGLRVWKRTFRSELL